MPQNFNKAGRKYVVNRIKKPHFLNKDGNVMCVAEKNVLSTHSLNPVRNVAKIMKDNDVRRLPVTDAGTGRLEGLATAMDILDFLGGGPKYKIIQKDFGGNLIAAINCPIRKIMRDASYVDRQASVDDVLKIMIGKHTSAIPVIDDKKNLKVVGIVTERDLLPQGDSFGITVEEVMNTKPIIATPGMMISDVSKIMVRNGFRRLPVILEDKLVGVVTVFDILEFIGYGEFKHADAEEALSERVEEIMRKDVVSVDQDQDIASVAGLIESSGIGGFPVVEGDKLIGIITSSDVIKAAYGCRG